ncbi:MAG: nitrilase-related carbon-nitrogen hydrolase, partial [Clostridia bacterium]
MVMSMIKAAVVTPVIRVADCAFNGKKIFEAVHRAAQLGARVIVTPELCVTGATCGDLFLQTPLRTDAENTVDKLRDACRLIDAVVLVGAPLVRNGALYSCAVVMYKGEILGAIPKTNISHRHNSVFTQAPCEVSTITIAGRTCKFGTNLLFRCVDLPELTLAAELGEDGCVPNSPSISHALAGATVIANLSAVCEGAGMAEYRRGLIASQSQRLICGYMYAEAGRGESTSDMTFSGHDMIAENGHILSESAPFGAGFAISEIDVSRLMSDRLRTGIFGRDEHGYNTVDFKMKINDIKMTRHVSKTPFIPEDVEKRDARCEEIITMQADGLARRLSHTGAKCAVIGISGGLDSCLAMLVAVRAMDMLSRPSSDVLAVTMPCFGTTARTRTNAEKMANALGVRFQCVDISDAVRRHFSDIGQDEGCHDVTFENSQAR